LDLEKHPDQVRPPAARLVETGKLGADVEVGPLALGEASDRLLHLTGRETQLRHHLAGGGNLQFRHPPIRFGEIAHHTESRAEEALTNARNLPGGQRLVVSLGVELVTQQQANRRSDRPRGNRAQQSAEGFADPFHPQRHGKL
jgi:hypothetical protein